jgi:hypothetical protein
MSEDFRDIFAMMLKKNTYAAVFVFILILDLQHLTQSIDLASTNKCLIHNFKHKYEYLVLVRDYQNLKYFSQNRAFAASINLVKDFTLIEWKLVPVNSSSSDQTFYMKSDFHDSYLCGSNITFESEFMKTFNRFVYQQRFMVFGIKQNEYGRVKKMCQWTFKKVEAPKNKPELLKNYKNTYEIWSTYYNKPLYAIARRLLDFSNNKRDVFLCHKKSDSNEFKWNVDCKTGEFLTE